MDEERRMIVKELAVYCLSKDVQTLLKKKLKTNWKSSEQSRKLRIEGNDSYAKASNVLQMEETYKLYSKSIAFAESDSEELASAYGNRSAILFRMKKYKECIADIDLATKISNSDKFKIKLLCRKIECMNLQGLTKSEEIFSEVESLVSAMKDDTTKEEYKKLFEKSKNLKATKVFKSEGKQIPKHVKILKEKENENLFDSISIKWNKKCGRYLVANRDFNAGEIVFIEKPFVKVVNLKNSHMFCSHCLTVSWVTIPCNYCNWCMFCSEECKNTSWIQYHNLECAVVSQIIKKNGVISNYEQLTIRALILGIKDAGSIKNLKSELESVDACTSDKSDKSFKSNDDCKSMGLKSMYTLNDDVDVTDLPIFTTNSVFILLSLIKNTSLFDSRLKSNPENILANDEVLFVGSLLLKLHKINVKNIQQLPGEKGICKYNSDEVTCNSTYCCTGGFSTMTIASLFKNSCHPHVAHIVNKQLKFIVCSLRPIKKDSEIFINYCGHWAVMPKAHRQMILRGFNFICNCEACEQNWPTLEELIMSIQSNPAALHSFINRKEKYHMFANDDIERLFLDDFSNANKCTLSTIKTLSKGISNAYKDLKHPSAALAKLEVCMQGALKALYDSSVF